MVGLHCIVAILLKTSGLLSSNQLVVIGSKSDRGHTTLSFDYGKKKFPTLRNQRIYMAPNRNLKTGISVTIYCSKVFDDKEVISAVTKGLTPTKSSTIIDNDPAAAKKCNKFLVDQNNLASSSPGKKLDLKLSDVLERNACDIRNIGRFAEDSLVKLTGKNNCISPNRVELSLTIEMDAVVPMKDLLFRGEAILGPQGVSVRMAMGFYLEELHLFALRASGNPTWSFVTSLRSRIKSDNMSKIFNFIFDKNGEFNAFKELVDRSDPGTFSSRLDIKSQGSKNIIQKTNSAIASQNHRTKEIFNVQEIIGKLECTGNSIRGGKLDRNGL
ncbi:unnamed protein product [Blumeria hordei]|uniref:Uncharacterized protein n=1 Tax=Blumeria hordei TaxID=2867405 RepID=A0A383UYD0_BLUHO|nr:unnamed protein product [Blumeria hordei]